MNVHNVALGGLCENYSCSSKILCSIIATVVILISHWTVQRHNKPTFKLWTCLAHLLTIIFRESISYCWLLRHLSLHLVSLSTGRILH